MKSFIQNTPSGWLKKIKCYDSKIILELVEIKVLQLGNNINRLRKFS